MQRQERSYSKGQCTCGSEEESSHRTTVRYSENAFPDRSINAVNSQASSQQQYVYSPNSFHNYEAKGPPMPQQSTPKRQLDLPSGHETFGTHIDYNSSWIANDAHQSFRSPGSTSSTTYSRRNPNIGFNRSSTMNTKYLEQSSHQVNSVKSPKSGRKEESLLEWYFNACTRFDRNVEKELQNRREGSLNIGENLVNLNSPSRVNFSLPSKPSNRLIVEASTSNIDIPGKLRKQLDTDLLDAVDKLAKAEAMVSFEGAVRAAEEAAAAAPPELAEEAAAAGAQGFQAELTGVVRHEFEGIKPIEVIGYVGITRPKRPIKSTYGNRG